MLKKQKHIILMLLLLIVGVGQLCGQSASIWDGTVATAFAGGSGTQADPYIINSAAQLAYFGSQMNGKSWYVKLNVDIDLNNREWTYGKNSVSNFKGHFDGDGHTISNLMIVPTSAKNNGFFSSLQGTAASRAEVKNLILDGVTISQTGALAATTTTGALAGNVTEYTDIDNVTVKDVTITLTNLSNANYVGGFVGRVQQYNCVITNCTVESPTLAIGTLSTKASYVGGAIGYVAGSANLVTTINGLNVTSPSVTIDKITIADCYIGAVFGRIYTYCDVTNVTVDSPTLTYKNTANTTVAIYLGSFGNIGGSSAYKTSVTNVTISNTAQMTLGSEGCGYTVTNVRAGLIGNATSQVLLKDWSVAETRVTVNTGLANASSTYRRIGGFAGELSGAAGAPFTAENITVGGSELVVKANIAAATYLGGFAGNVFTNCQLKNCSVTSPTVDVQKDITTGASYIGGAIGDFSGAAGNTSFISGTLTVASPSVTVNKNSVESSSIGAVFGRINNYSVVDNVVASTPTLYYKNTDSPNFTLNMGSFAGYILGTSVQETVVTNITVSGNAQVTIGSTGNICKMRAGIIGYATTNIRLENWSVANSTIAANGNLATGSSYLGGFAGYLASATGAPLTLSNIKVTNSTVTPSGNISVASYLGGFAGYIAPVAGTPIQASDVSVGTANLTINGQITAGSYFGGLVGKAAAGSILTNWNILTGANLTFNNTISVLSYVGGAIGSLEGSAGNPVSASGFDVKGLNINLNCDLTKGIYVGGIIGNLNAVAQVNRIEKSSVSGKIHTTGSHTFSPGNITYAFGGVVGYLPQSSTTFSEVNSCVSEVDFNLCGLVSSSVSGSNYNLYSGFVVGGVIGRINTAFRLPESLYYSGKIYAPFAAVGPIVGVFGQNAAAAAYLYHDYSGENANAAISEEWVKAGGWYYNNYKIGLSPEVISQTARSKNYTATPTTTEGVPYLTISDTTLKAFNSISGAQKHSKTILPYTTNNKNQDKGIYPQWTTTSATYPAYYMYYMQGVNRGVFVADDEVETIKTQVLSGISTLLTLTDANADFRIAANRGIVSHTLTATSSDADSYRWYIDGVLQAETTATFSVTPAIQGNIIAVEAMKNSKVLKRAECRVYSVFRVRDAAAEVGIKTNPYLIGSVKELQLLSHLSTLRLNTTWEKTYTSDNHYNKAYYELDADIDLSGVDNFTPISCASGFVASGAMSLGYIFDGVFDGKGYKISGLKEEWYGGAINVNDSYQGWGLFAAVGSPTPTTKVGDSQPSPAVVRNLVIDGATLTHKTSNVTFNYNNNTANNNTSGYSCLGVLAGIVLNNTKIENIEIRNSQITDEGSSDYTLATRGLYVGGIIGSIQNSINDVATTPANIVIHHIAAQADITMEHPTFYAADNATQLAQFNVGGIIGRYIATVATQDQVQAVMPSWTFYSGNITAPKAWISPVMASLRYASQNAYSSGSMANYSKQWEGNNNSASSKISIPNAQYYNFRINGELMTELRPETACAMGARPILPHTDATETMATYNAQKYQGVNYGAHYLDSEGTSLELMNASVSDGVYWAWDDEGAKKFIHMSTVQPMRVYISQEDRLLCANIENGSAPFVYSWQESTDLENWTTIDGVSSGTWNVPLTYNEEKYIVAQVVKDGKFYRSFPFLYTPSSFINPPAIVENVSGGQHDFTIDWHDLDLTGLGITYQWYESNQSTEIPGATSSSLSLSQTELDRAGGTIWCKAVLTQNSETFAEFFLSNGRIVVFVDGSKGVDNELGSRERGWTPQTPVKTIDHANSLLDGGSWDKNIIVIMGTLNSDGDFRSNGKNPATLTGRWDGVDYAGVIKIKQIHAGVDAGGKADEHSLNPVCNGQPGSNSYVLADTKFEYLTFRANSSSDGNNLLELHGNNVWFGKGLEMKNFKKLSDSHGNLDNAQNIPELTIVLTGTNPNEAMLKKYTNRATPQVVTIESGHYGRFVSGRFTDGFFSKTENTGHSILGSAQKPMWVVFNVDIDRDNPNTDKYTCDINAIVAGLTDGTMYGDLEINLHGGKICYVVGANQGNCVVNGNKIFTPVGGNSGNYGQWPNSSFFGRTIINVDEQDGLKPLEVQSIYAGGLGRSADPAKTPTIVDMYVYGRTAINVKNGSVNGELYGGGAGGVLGKNPWDAHVPYATSAADDANIAVMNGVQYGTWGAKKPGDALATVTLHNADGMGGYTTEMLSLDSTSTTISISGGTVNGSVYGGGYGYVSNMPDVVTMQGVGSVFGNSTINITGGTIIGSVYGGSRGHRKYYGIINKYGQTITNIAELNGNVNVNISGTPEKYPTITGNIYGGGAGIESNGGEEYLRIATTGNMAFGDEYKTQVNLTIDLPEEYTFTGNIYGGGEMGTVDGNTTVIIKNGTIEGNVFGGGKGELGHPEKAKVIGETHVIVGE